MPGLGGFLSMSGSGFEQPFDKGDDPFPEEPDCEETAQQAADEKLKDVAARARVKVAICQLKRDRGNEREENQQRQEPTIATAHYSRL